MHSALPHLTALVHKRRPLQLTYFVTRRCNLCCPFCFYLGSTAPPPAPAPELSLDEIEPVTRSVGRLLWLAFSGGEVFLRNDLVEMTKLFYANTRPTILLYPTNGQLPALTHERIERILHGCPGSIVVVKLSLDGVGAAHDRLRGRDGCFEKVMETYRLLRPLRARHRRFELGVNTVLGAPNEEDVDALIDFVAELGDVPHTVSLVRGRLRDRRWKAVDPERYARVAARLAEGLTRNGARYRFRSARLKAAQDIVQRRVIHRTLATGARGLPCHAGVLNLVLSETGEVYPCEMRDESFGNVRDHGYDIQRVVRSAAARAVTQSIREGSCACTHECYVMTNVFFNVRCYPALLREYVRLGR